VLLHDKINIMGKIKKVIYIIIGSLAFGVGMIGIVIRGIPTTPLLLTALFFWSRSSERLATWLENQYFYKKYLHNYVKTKSMALKQKIMIQIFASIMMIISFVLINILIVRVILVLCFIAHHYVFIFKIKTYKPELLEASGPQIDMKKE
jgi:uncharacterized membrane protein YbaN (DUF454 family)